MGTKETKKWWILGALSFALLAVGLDMTVLNVALPTLATSLNASTSQLQWFADSYNLVLAALLLPAGMLGDRYGRKKMLLIALLVFGAGSIGCANSDSPEMLISMRVFLGLGAAFLLPLSISVLPVFFHGEERSRAMMIWAITNMLGIPLGPIVGGWLLKHFEWGSVFWINIPFVVIGLVAISFLMPENRSKISSKIDYLGIFTSSIGLTMVTYAVIRAGEKGWSDASVIILLIVGVVILGIFTIWQRYTKHPLIDLSLFRSASFTWGSILATLVSFAMFGLLFAIPQFFQAVKGYDTFGTGLRLLPMIAGLMVGAKISDQLSKRIGSKNNVAIGFLVLAIGLGIGAWTDLESGYWFAALWITISGIGLGLSLPNSMDAALAELSAERSGIGSALIMALRQVGGTIGVAILGTVINSSYRHHLNMKGLPSTVTEKVEQSVSAGVVIAKQLKFNRLLDSVQKAFIHGMDMMLIGCSGIAIIGCLLAFLFLPHKQHGAKKANKA
ncbi:DHA2 family efflux MFS transporter permease subunit [Heyndrickxia ginsengihumi]|uniref:DHA2 family efflux MFS transporter permease subunit n=2 Tax=Heyndrickxia ginsengihumi TaxID=363870 RepID=UPI000472E7E0|nr:DHA2 family efflux MFS transporter permease subunit [Heyndrickxia ginsengihumi]MBE6182982.1 DHA2 family efflux MFS transporter permease subunit [Bacillus sp. (in: firmicutes)]